MAIELERVRSGRTGESAGVGEGEGGLPPGAQDEIRGAADRVGRDRLGASLGDLGDDFSRVSAGAGPRIQLAQAGTFDVPTGWLGGGSASPIPSADVVRRMEGLGALGRGGAARFDPSRYQDLLNRDPAAPFTGSGATGRSPTESSIPPGDLAAMMRFHQAERDERMLTGQLDELARTRGRRPDGISDDMERRRQELLDNRERLLRGNLEMTRRVMQHLSPTVDRYRNPLSGAPTSSEDPRDHFDARTRERQAELMLNQPISTLHRSAYGDRLPTRAEVVEAAARRYNLDPSVLAGFMLHEQRDQSRLEDAAEFGGATLAGRDNSLGLGQVLMSTAMRDNADLLSDTIDPATRARLGRGEVARLLTSDEHNIWATARYLRRIADQGAVAGSGAGSLPDTRGAYHGIDFNAYRGARWNDDNIRAIASEYTSRPWDDRVLPPGGYPQFVLEAVNDIRRAGIFRR